MQETNELIGYIDVVDLLDDNKTATIGYVLSHKYWNNGISTEALSTVITKLFDDGIETIKAEHHIDNIESGRVMEKCGMKFTHNDKAQGKFGSTEKCDVKCYEIRK